LNLLYGLQSNPNWLTRVSLVSLVMAGTLIAEPSPIDDEDFLLFLADSVEKDGEWIDPLSMVEDSSEQTAPEHDIDETKQGDSDE
jgi:hypothetical protein